MTPSVKATRHRNVVETADRFLALTPGDAPAEIEGLACGSGDCCW